MRTRTALFLCLFAVAGAALAGMIAGALPAGLRVWMGALTSLAFFGGAAYLGLCVMDGDQSRLLLTRRLSSAQALWLCACGALLVCPATLFSDILAALSARLAAALGLPAAQAAVQGHAGLSLFLPVLLCSGVIAPVCEELFFRGYLMGVFARRGAAQAAFVTALLFAAAHGVGQSLPLYLLLGLLFAAAMLRTGSLLAPVMLHMGYNTALIVLSATPLSGAFAGLNPLSCVVRLLGCAGLIYTLKRAWLARGARDVQAHSFRLTRREALLLLGALLLAAAAQATAIFAAGGNA